MNNNRAFSVIEVVIVVVIVGILAGVSFVKFQKTVAANDLNKEANNLYLELRGLRAITYKFDDSVKVLFNPTATPPQCTIKVFNSEASPPAYQTLKIYKINPPIKLGVPSGYNTSVKPYTDGWWITNPGPGSIVNGVHGEWKTKLYVNPNSRAQYAQGGVYLCHPRLTTTTYFIGINNAMQTIELKKWNGGSTWDNL